MNAKVIQEFLYFIWTPGFKGRPMHKMLLFYFLCFHMAETLKESVPNDFLFMLVVNAKLALASVWRPWPPRLCNKSQMKLNKQWCIFDNYFLTLML